MGFGEHLEAAEDELDACEAKLDVCTFRKDVAARPRRLGDAEGGPPRAGRPGRRRTRASRLRTLLGTLLRRRRVRRSRGGY